ncbi:hypothetical protein ACFZC7_00155, partial [Streptomyces massasporeus]
GDRAVFGDGTDADRTGANDGAVLEDGTPDGTDANDGAVFGDGADAGDRAVFGDGTDADRTGANDGAVLEDGTPDGTGVDDGGARPDPDTRDGTSGESDVTVRTAGAVRMPGRGR